jgi:Holliday junction resolvase
LHITYRRDLESTIQRNSFVHVTLVKKPRSNGSRVLSNYEAGRRLEYRIRDMFRRQGYLVIRAAQSKPIDLVALRDGRTLLVECKAGGSYLGNDRKKELLSLAELTGAKIIIATRRKRQVELTTLADGKLFDPKNLATIP